MFKTFKWFVIIAACLPSAAVAQNSDPAVTGAITDRTQATVVETATTAPSPTTKVDTTAPVKQDTTGQDIRTETQAAPRPSSEMTTQPAAGPWSTSGTEQPPSPPHAPNISIGPSPTVKQPSLSEQRSQYIEQSSGLLPDRFRDNANLKLFPGDESLETYIPNEIVISSDTMEQAREIANHLNAFNARLLKRKRLPFLGMVISVFQLPERPANDVLNQIQQKFPDLHADLNHFYRTQSSPQTSPNDSFIQLTSSPVNINCDRVKIGMMDGPIDIEHPALANQRIHQQTFIRNDQQKAPHQHATAIASIWLAFDPSLSLTQPLLPNAQLFNAVIMKNQNTPAASVEAMLLGLNWLLEKKVDVINLSLSGPHNRLLQKAVERTTLKSTIVAAGGNTGGNSPVYPAAYPSVIAVSAIDSRLRLARNATQGDHIDLAAPGVDIWVADAANHKGLYMSGSSIAAPWVSAAIAMLGHTQNPRQIEKNAKDLGDPGKDPQFGWGLVQLANKDTCSYL